MDRELLFAVYAGTRTEEMALVPGWSDEQKGAFLRQQFEAQDRYYREHYPGASFDVIVAEGVGVGRLYVARWPEEIRLVDLALLPEHRAFGLGTRVLSDLQDEARASDRPLRIHVERYNRALRLYERLGFRVIEDRGVYLFLEWRAASVTPRAEGRT